MLDLLKKRAEKGTTFIAKPRFPQHHRETLVLQAPAV